MRVLVVAPGLVRTAVSKNALDAQAQARGVSDAAIDNGMDPDLAAARILDALSTGQRELILAEGGELATAQLRRSGDSEALFDRMAMLMQAGYARQLGAEVKK